MLKWIKYNLCFWTIEFQFTKVMQTRQKLKKYFTDLYDQVDAERQEKILHIIKHL